MAAVRHFLRTETDSDALHFAAFEGRLEVCQVLLAARAKIEAKIEANDANGPVPPAMAF